MIKEKLIYLVRHAEPDYPGGVRMCLGKRNDLPLSAYGQTQAQALKRFFESVPFEAVYASPLLRAQQTAQAIAGRTHPLHTIESLTELDGGQWDGLTFDQIRERYPGYFLPGSPDACPPDGETDEDGTARMLSALHDVAGRTQRCAIIVAHSGVNRLLLCTLLGLPSSEKRRMRQGFAAVNLLAQTESGFTVRALDMDIR